MLTRPSRRTSRPAFFARLADGRGRERLAAVDVAAGKHPQAVAGLDRAADEHQPRSAVRDDRADGDLRIEVEDEAARGADEAIGLGRLQAARSSVPPQRGQKR